MIENIIEDWATIKKRWEAWWQGELFDRVLLHITRSELGKTLFRGGRFRTVHFHTFSYDIIACLK
jgi:hypothetical protein